MATTSSTPTKPPLINERDRRGIKVRSLNADTFTIARLAPEGPGRAYIINIDIIGVRLLTGSGSSVVPAGYAISRRLCVVTDANSVPSQVGTTDTIGADKNTDSNWSLTIAIDSTGVNFNLSAEFAADWSAYVVLQEVDQFQVG